MMPRVILHVAVSADGRIDGIQPDLGLFYGLISTWKEDATLAGSETILNGPEKLPEDDLTESEPPAVGPADLRPLLVIPDSRGRVRCWSTLRKLPYWRGMVALCSKATPEEHLDYLGRKHIDFIIAGDDRVDLRAALTMLGLKYGVKTVRADSGGILNGVLLREGLVDEVSILICPSLVGGTSPRSLFRAPDLTSPEGVIPLSLEAVERLEGDVVWLRYRVTR